MPLGMQPARRGAGPMPTATTCSLGLPSLQFKVPPATSAIITNGAPQGWHGVCMLRRRCLLRH